MTRDNPLRRSRSTKRVFALVLVLSVLVAVLSLAGPASASIVFSDGFESGNLAAWTGSAGMTVQPDVVFAGSYAARATSTAGTSAYAYKSLQTPLTDLYYDGRFNFVSAGNNNVSVVRFRTSAVGSILSLFRRNDGSLLYYNEVTGASTLGPIVSSGWHELLVHVLINGTSSQIAVWLDGNAVASMTKTDSLGTTAVGRVYIGEPSAGRTFDLALDSQLVSNSADFTAPTIPTGLTANAVGSNRVDLAWNPASDTVGVTGYTVYRNGVALATLGATTSYSDTNVTLGNSYTYSVDAFDAAGNHSSQSAPASVTIVSSDLTPPTTPGNFAAAASSATRVDLSWSQATDNVGVAGYTVYRDNAVLMTLAASSTSYSDTTASPHTTYSYAVDAFDAAANHSPPTTPVPVTTPALPDTSAPSVPANPSAAATSSTSTTLSWSPSTDNVGVTGYTIYRNGTQVATVAGDKTSYDDTNLLPATTYGYTVDAFDLAGNHSSPSSPASVTTPPASDVTPPSQPTDLAASATSPTSVDLSWDPSTDDVGVVGYTVYRNGAALSTSATTSFTDATAQPSKTYTYVVDAFDAGGNHSPASNSATVVTPTLADSVAPSIPTNVAGSAVSPSSVNISWSPSTDNVSVIGYTIYRNGTAVGAVDGTSNTFSDTGLAPATTYGYAVDAYDSAGNRSQMSTAAAVTTPAAGDTTPPSTPLNVAAAANGPTSVTVSWNASTDNVAVTGYTIYRNGSVIANVGGSITTFADNTAKSSTTYAYTVDAFDGSGNRSVQSAPVTVTTPGPLFNDGFESGSLSQWQQAPGVTVQTSIVYQGQYAARVTTTGATAAYAYRSLATARPEVYYDGFVNVQSQAANSGSVSLVRFRGSTGTAILSLFRNQANKLAVYNEVTGVTTTTTATLSGNAWHEIEVHLWVNGTAGRVELWLDGTKVLSQTDNTGSTLVGRVYIGDPAAGKSYDIAFDNQLLSTAADLTPPSPPTNVVASALGSNRVNITWQASTDDTGISSYIVTRNGVDVGTSGPNALGWIDATVSGNTSYSYTVSALDPSGNRSAPSSPSSAVTPAGSPGDPVVAAAGDISCDPDDPNYNNGLGTAAGCQQKATSDLVWNDPTISTVLDLGDNQYEDNTLTKYNLAFDPTWGRLRSILKPVPGNHEYQTPGAAGYYAYFGAAAGDPSKGYYSYDIGTWHVVALNGECSFVGGCQKGSPQEQWLAADLAAHPAQCTIAYWHEPRFSSGFHGDELPYGDFWNDLYASHAEIVLNGHDHDYERFAPQTPDQVFDPNGIREFVVGSGGAESTASSSPSPNSQIYANNAFGVLKLTLHQGSYDWQFVPAAGTTFTDSGSGTCH
jgi:fibronectin type 3 domain-containing protein